MNRKNIVLTNEYDNCALTLMYPMSSEHEGKLFVIYEDALGDVQFKIMKLNAICLNYDVDETKVNSFYDEMSNKNKE